MMLLYEILEDIMIHQAIEISELLPTIGGMVMCVYYQFTTKLSKSH